MGEVPPKRHTQLRREGRLLTEQVMGMEGFSGNYSILYHLETPCRVMALGGFEHLEKKEWVPDQHQHMLFATADLDADGDLVTGRRLLMWNSDVEIWFCRPRETSEGYYRNGEGDEVIFVHQGGGVAETIFGDLPYREGDYIVIPRGMHLSPGTGRRTEVSDFRFARPDRDSQALSERLRKPARTCSLLPPRHSRADRAENS